MKDKIAIVTPRYGNIVGGSEAIAKECAILLSTKFDIDILTSTSTNSTTWQHDDSIIDDGDISIIRFRAKAKPSVQFTESTVPYGYMAHDYETIPRQDIYRIKNIDYLAAKEFTDNIGPYTPDLYIYLKEHSHRYRKVIFTPYLMSGTSNGIRYVSPSKRIIIPAIHREQFILLKSFKELADAHWLIYTNAEIDIFKEAQGITPRSFSTLIPNIRGTQIPIKKNHNSALLFAGRASMSKGTDSLFNAIADIRHSYNKNISLSFMGVVDPNTQNAINTIPWVNGYGYVEESNKGPLINNHMALINPSILDSFGIVNMEALMYGIPSIVNNDCPAFNNIIEDCPSGILKYNTDISLTLKNTIDAIDDPIARQNITKQGQQWVIDTYNKSNMYNSLIKAIEL